MDFINWCDMALNMLIEVRDASPQARGSGVDEFALAEGLSKSLGIINFRTQPEYYQSSYYHAMLNAVTSLKQVNCIEDNERSRSHWKVSRTGREHITDPVKLWFSICQETLETEHKKLLSVVNRLSPQTAPDHVWLKDIEHEVLRSELGEPAHLLWNSARELEQEQFISGFFSAGGTVQLKATYKGLVWETRRGFTIESKFIDDLVKEWETTSVDFKRELYTDTADQKAELIKDVLSLVNTQASGRRWLIIGFDDKTRQYYGPPNPKLTQNHLEQILKQYTSPMVDIRYEIVDYRQGKVGKLEILRDPKKLPYCAARSIGDKKRIEQGKIFVRHGSQVEEPTTAELQALLDECSHIQVNPS